MRSVANIFSIGFILWLGWKFFPSKVQADGLSKIVIVAALLYIVCAIVMFVVSFIIAESLIIFYNRYETYFSIIVVVALCFGIAVLANFITLISISDSLIGFTIVGF